MIRVLLIDDSSVVRRIVGRAIETDPRVTLVGAASSGEAGLRMLEQYPVDAVILDVSMPGMDGLQVLDVIRSNTPALPVVLFSSLIERGGSVTFEGIARGATDHLAKPRGGPAQVAQNLETLLDKVVGAHAARAHLRSVRDAPIPSGEHRERRRPPAPELIVIGCSTGGPNALADILDQLPADLPVPIVVVQHMPPVLTRYLAKRLDMRTPLDVFEATHGDELRPGAIAITPGGYHIEVSRGTSGLRVYLNQDEPVNSCRPSVDVLFESAARTCGSSVVAAVLTGMGQDGLRGCRAIREAGGHIVVQSGDTCVVWGMPRVVETAGLADEVVPLSDMARRLASHVLVGA